MKVHELITQLQDCDRPDAEVNFRQRDSKERAYDLGDKADVFYESVASNIVVVEVQEPKW